MVPVNTFTHRIDTFNEIYVHMDERFLSTEKSSGRFPTALWLRVCVGNLTSCRVPRFCV